MWKNADLNVGDLTQTPEGRPGGSGGGGRDDVGSSADGLLASTAVPDANRVPLDGVLAAEGACVPGVLADFHTLDLLPQGGTISSTVLAGDTDLGCALRHCD